MLHILRTVSTAPPTYYIPQDISRGQQQQNQLRSLSAVLLNFIQLQNKFGNYFDHSGGLHLVGYTVYTFHNAIKVGDNNINNNNKKQETFEKGS